MVEINKSRKLAIDVIEIFEDFLDERNISIPSEDRELKNIETEACIFGTEYYWLEDTLADLFKGKLKWLITNIGC